MNVLLVCKDDGEVLRMMGEALETSRCSGVTWYFDWSTVEEEENQEYVASLLWLQRWSSEIEIKLVFTFGGDGTVLHAAWLFQSSCSPPIVPIFVHGTLGFLTGFDHSKYQTLFNQLVKRRLQQEFDGEDAVLDVSLQCGISCRMRLQCTLGDRIFHVLNEVVVDRGPISCLLQLDLYGGTECLTTILADGVVIATPTGSTAYSMSAGGAIVHPQVPGILLTPICAHTLSFRPLVLPDHMSLRLSISPHSRTSTAWVSFDGRHRLELTVNSWLEIAISKHPVYIVSEKDHTSEWFRSLSTCLHWNDSRTVWGRQGDS